MLRCSSKDGTQKIYTYRGETMNQDVGMTNGTANKQVYPVQTPEVEALVRDIIGKIADKWTLLVLDFLEEKGAVRFGEINRGVTGVSQKMLTKTLRQMESDGLITRVVHPVIPPRVEYTLTDMGKTLTCAFCGVWMWAAENHAEVQSARAKFRQGAD
jgi:DNA-binding HxlR family transcriptional regulator